jgi:hypothetical protein
MRLGTADPDCYFALSECMVRRRVASEIEDDDWVCANVFGLLWNLRFRAMMQTARPLPYKLDGLRRTSSDIRFRERRIDRCAISRFTPADLAGTDSFCPLSCSW